MDRREEETIETIYQAFTNLINTKDFDDITIQNILDEAKIGRSTFYCHFKTKNDLLLKISQDIFEHVFSHSLQEEKSHDFSKENIFDYKHYLTHIFYHIKDKKELIAGILSSKGNSLFINEFRNNLKVLANSYFNNYPYPTNSFIPLELKKNIAIDNFIVILKFWVDNHFEETPEVLTEYFTNLFIK